jgi:hypothetical protein
MPGPNEVIEEAITHVETQDQETAANETPQADVSDLDLNDPDDKLLAELRQTALAEEAAAAKPDEAATPSAPVSPTATGSEPEPKTPVEEPAGAKPQTVPISRLNEVIEERRERDLRIARLEGELAARQALQTAPAPAAPAQPEKPKLTPDQVITQARAYKLVLAEQFDAGDITAKQQAEKVNQLDVAIDRAREQILEAKQPKAPADNGEITLGEIDKRLESSHPWLFAFNSDEGVNSAEWLVLEQIALRELAARGTVNDGSVKYHAAFKEMLAEKSEEVGRRFFPDFVPRGSTPTPAAKGPSPMAVARGKKLDLAASAPPDISGIPATGTGAIEYTDAQIMAMTPDQLDKLPKSTIEKVLGPMTF